MFKNQLENEDDSGYDVSSAEDEAYERSRTVYKFPSYKAHAPAKDPAEQPPPKKCCSWWVKAAENKVGSDAEVERQSVMLENLNYKRQASQDNWRKLKRRVIQHLKMKRMVDYMTHNNTDDRRDSDDEMPTRCERLMIDPDNAKLRYWNHFMAYITLLDFIYIISL